MATPGPLPPEYDAGGLRFWLLDDYVDLLGDQRVVFSRQVREIVSPDGLQPAASFEVDFDPSYQRLVVHHLRVQRAGEVRDLARPEYFEVLRRERDLERARYDGRLTAHVILPDLRIGDVVDACYSVVGKHPLIGSRLSATPDFQWSLPVVRTRFRVFAPSSRDFAVHYWGRRPEYARTALKNGNVLHTWVADRFPALTYDPSAPSWWIGHARAQISDATSWSEVADLFRPGYAAPDQLPTELEEHADAILRAEPYEAGRIAAALKLIQRDVRYLSIGMGDGGVVPRPVEEIWRTRFGDCKDKSKLLTTLLIRLGVDAVPALVHTSLGPILKDCPPCVGAFNHCIVRVRSGGRTWWLDPTLWVQGGRLERLDQSRVGWALPVKAGSDLEDTGQDELLTLYEQHERIVFGPRRDSPAELHIRCFHRGWRADNFRRRLSNEGAAAVSKGYLDYYQGHYGPMTVAAPLEIDDHEADNEVHTTESYVLQEPWRLSDDELKASFQTLDEVLREQLPRSSVAVRTMPLDLGAIRRVVQTVALELPSPWSLKEWNDSWEVGGVAASSSATQQEQGRRILLQASAEVRQRSLPAGLEPVYSKNVERIVAGAAVTLTHTVRNGEFTKTPKKGRLSLPRWWPRLIWLFLLAAYWIYKLVTAH